MHLQGDQGLAHRSNQEPLTVVAARMDQDVAPAVTLSAWGLKIANLTATAGRKYLKQK
jgi:hypothetical protein